MSTKVLLVDEQSVVCEQFQRALSSHRDVEIMMTRQDGREVLRAAFEVGAGSRNPGYSDTRHARHRCHTSCRLLSLTLQRQEISYTEV